MDVSIELVMVSGKKRVLLGSLGIQVELKERLEMAIGEPDTALTGQEKKIKDLIVEGLCHKEVADRLHLSIRTAKFHATSVYRKYGVRDRPALLMLLRRLGDVLEGAEKK